MMKGLLGFALALSLVACGRGGSTTIAPGGTPTTVPTTSSATSPPPSMPAAGIVAIPPGTDLCGLLSASDFADAGVGGAGPVSTNSYDTEFNCVYAGASVATGGIELDAFIVDSDTDRDEIFASVAVPENAEDVGYLLPGATRATLGTTTSGGPEFAEIAVESGNLIFGLGVPSEGDWRGPLIDLARLVLTRAIGLSPQP
jgi:hypothetical protein